MRKSLLFVAGLCLIGLVPVFASAQNTTLTCSDFKRNPDGSWSAVHPITLNGVTFGPGMNFSPGVSFGGVDLASVLNQRCI